MIKSTGYDQREFAVMQYRSEHDPDQSSVILKELLTGLIILDFFLTFGQELREYILEALEMVFRIETLDAVR